LLHLEKARGDLIQGFIPGNLLPLPCPLWTDTAHGVQQTIGVMDTLGVASDLFADHASRIGIILGTAHAADCAVRQDVDIEGTDRRTVVRADGADGAKRAEVVHAATLAEAKRRHNRIVVMGGIREGDGARQRPPPDLPLIGGGIYRVRGEGWAKTPS